MLSPAQKLNILGEAARYDASCSSSGSGRQGKKGGLGNAHMAGICHSWTEDGRCMSLLKVLYSNACIYNCAYCANRSSNDVPRASFTPKELAEIVIEFYKRNYIEGLFLSSGILRSPDYTMEQMIEALTLLREEYGYCGYIHVKVIPGADPRLVEKIGMLADRISVNIELPTRESLALLAPEKKPEAITKPMRHIRDTRIVNFDERKKFKNAPLFAPAGQATQMIIGATPEKDATILRLASGLYKSYNVKRVYYSAYLPVNNHPYLPALETRVPLLREHRLYQADWLLRFYEFGVEEILDSADSDLDLRFDPKCAWALRNIDLFPLEVNKADYLMLLRVPGIGVQSARRIIAARRVKALRWEDLSKLGIVMKRAQYFVMAQGKSFSKMKSDNLLLPQVLTETPAYEQLNILDVPKPVNYPALAMRN
jgi:putative DNA modification/repair radical SAM protein